MDFKKCIENYAELAVRIGVNIQPGQTLVINSPIECYEFIRIVTKKAYEAGAKNVHVEWNDEEINHIKFLNAPFEAFKEYPAWRAEGLESLAKNGAAFLSISASNPELLKDVDPERISTAAKTASIALKGYRQYIMNSSVAWCVLSLPTKGWSAKVFEGIDSEAAIETLWENIFKIVRADRPDPVAAWKEHTENLTKKINWLNEMNFKYLHYKSEGTDLKIELHKDHIWCGGGEYNKANTYFIANMPTEEIFTVPLKEGVNGTVKSTKPLNYGGNLINDFSLTFKDGKIVDFTAKQGYEILKRLIEIDEGSHYLGEVALVPHKSPISDTGIIFYNTLYDENASCHLAIGKGYETCIKDGADLSEEDVIKKGVNSSLTHNDFMIGSADLNIIGETHDGKFIQIFKNGNFMK